MAFINVKSDFQAMRKKRYALSQEAIRIKGRLKKAQEDLLASMNECAIAENCHYNALKKGVIMAKMKSAIMAYFKVYGDKIINEDCLNALDEQFAREYGVIDGGR